MACNGFVGERVGLHDTRSGINAQERGSRFPCEGTWSRSQFLRALAPASDYDCAGGSGNGPKYTGPVRVTGSDPYDLDRDGDGKHASGRDQDAHRGLASCAGRRTLEMQLSRFSKAKIQKGNT
jgi:hypothetical protein